MTVGTKSVLFGAHAFWLHPFFVAWGWWRLYGFPWDPRLWLLFFVHDLGYVGKRRMDDDIGETHPFFGARLAAVILDCPPWRKRSLNRRLLLRYSDPSRYGVDMAVNVIGGSGCRWGMLSLRHSRFLSERFGMEPSRLCWADKMAICLTPWWLYVSMARLTGEIDEYRACGQGGKTDDMDPSSPGWSDRSWYRGIQKAWRRRLAEMEGNEQ